MALEIERKFLLANEDWRNAVRASTSMSQGYLGGTRCAVRVRIAGDQAWLTIKSSNPGHTRHEFEYSVPVDEALEMLTRVADGPLIEKTRHIVEIDSHRWEIDEFHGDNQGLIVAEIELTSANESFARPGWLGEEVTNDQRYYNVHLARHPYRTWGEPS